MRVFAAMVACVALPACFHIDSTHRHALETMQPISDPLVDLLMQYEIPHTPNRQGSAKQ